MFKAVISVFLCLSITVSFYFYIEIKDLQKETEKLKQDITFLENHQIDVDVFCKAMYNLNMGFEASLYAIVESLNETGLFKKDYGRHIQTPRVPNAFLVAKEKEDEKSVNRHDRDRM